MEKETREERNIRWSGVTIGFLIGVIVIIVAVCLWEKFYTPPQARAVVEKGANTTSFGKATASQVKKGSHAKKASGRQEKRQEERVSAPAVIAPMQLVEQSVKAPPKWEPMIVVPIEDRNDTPNVRAVTSERVTPEAGSANSTTFVVVEGSVRNYERQNNPPNYVYGAYGNNCGWGGCGNSGVYCNSYGTSGWPCSQYQNNFVQPAPSPVYVPPQVIVQAAPPPPHHEHHHRHHNESPHSGGPVHPAGF